MAQALTPTETFPLAGIVLAGAEPRRFERDRDRLAIPGVTSTAVESVLTVVTQCCAPVFVVAAPGQPLPGVAATVLRDGVRCGEPLHATGRGLRAAAEAGRRYAFVCDGRMPHLTVAVISDLVRLAVETDAEVVLPWDGRSLYLAAVYRTDLANRIDALVASGEQRMSALIDASDCQQVVLAPQLSAGSPQLVG